MARVVLLNSMLINIFQEGDLQFVYASEDKKQWFLQCAYIVVRQQNNLNLVICCVSISIINERSVREFAPLSKLSIRPNISEDRGNLFAWMETSENRSSTKALKMAANSLLKNEIRKENQPFSSTVKRWNRQIRLYKTTTLNPFTERRPCIELSWSSYLSVGKLRSNLSTELWKQNNKRF